MALLYYELPIDWVPDPMYINEPPDYQYLAWKMGENKTTNKSLWAISEAVASPSVSIEVALGLAPTSFTSTPIVDDSPTLGFERDLEVRSTISGVRGKMQAALDFELGA